MSLISCPTPTPLCHFSSDSIFPLDLCLVFRHINLFIWCSGKFWFYLYISLELPNLPSHLQFQIPPTFSLQLHALHFSLCSRSMPPSPTCSKILIMYEPWNIYGFHHSCTLITYNLWQMGSYITLFRSITMLCRTDNIVRKISRIQPEWWNIL